MPPLIDVLIRAKNAAKFLPEALASLDAQTLPKSMFGVTINVEPSTDKTLAIAKRWVKAQKSREFGVVDGTEGEGEGATYNRLLWITQPGSPLVCQFDSDDTLEPTALETVVHLAVSNPEAVMFGCNVLLVDENNKPLPPEQQPSLSTDPFKRKPIRGIPTFRRAALDQFGGWNPRFPYAATYELELRLLIEHNQKFEVSEERLMRYRRHDGQVTQAEQVIQRQWVEEAMIKPREILASRQADPFGRT